MFDISTLWLSCLRSHEIQSPPVEFIQIAPLNQMCVISHLHLQTIGKKIKDEFSLISWLFLLNKTENKWRVLKSEKKNLCLLRNLKFCSVYQETEVCVWKSEILTQHKYFSSNSHSFYSSILPLHQQLSLICVFFSKAFLENHLK